MDGIQEWWTRPQIIKRESGVVTVGSTASDGGITVSTYDHVGTIRTVYSLYDIGGADDHVPPAVIDIADKPPLVFYSGHNADTSLRYRVGTTPHDFSTLGSEQTVTYTGGGNITYHQVFTRGNEVHHFTRGPSTHKWSYLRSTDWMESHSAPQEVVDFGSQTYMAAALLSDETTLRCAFAGHPNDTNSTNHTIRYVEINLETGDVTEPGNGVVGNVQTGSNLPLELEDLSAIYAPDGRTFWLFDVSDGPQPEIVIAEKDNDNMATTDSVYRYLTYDGNSWVDNDVIATGAVFGEAVGHYYVGGASFPLQSDGGAVFTSRKDGLWKIERWTTLDDGANWTGEVLEQSSLPIVRPTPVSGSDGELGYSAVSSYANFNTFVSSVVGRG